MTVKMFGITMQKRWNYKHCNKVVAISHIWNYTHYKKQLQYLSYNIRNNSITIEIQREFL
jgi:hypothetical protein